jgi:hypothetical protein
VISSIRSEAVVRRWYNDDVQGRDDNNPKKITIAMGA